MAFGDDRGAEDANARNGARLVLNQAAKFKSGSLFSPSSGRGWLPCPHPEVFDYFRQLRTALSGKPIFVIGIAETSHDIEAALIGLEQDDRGKPNAVECRRLNHRVVGHIFENNAISDRQWRIE